MLHLEKSELVFTSQSCLYGDEQFILDVSDCLAAVQGVMTAPGLNQAEKWYPQTAGPCDVVLASLPACVAVPVGFIARVREFTDNAQTYALKAITAKRAEGEHIWDLKNLTRTIHRLQILREADLHRDHTLVGKTIEGTDFELEREDRSWHAQIGPNGIVPLERGQVVELRGLDVVRTWALPHLPLLCLSPWVGDRSCYAGTTLPGLRLHLQEMRDSGFLADATMLANIEAMVQHRLQYLVDATGRPYPSGQTLLITNHDGVTKALFGNMDYVEVSVRHYVTCKLPFAGFPVYSVMQVEEHSGKHRSWCVRFWALRHDPELWFNDTKFLNEHHQERLLYRLGRSLWKLAPRHE
jgi:hypothetical protein